MHPKNNLRFAQVVAIRPQSRTVEIVYIEDGWRENNVPILCDYSSSDTGAWSQHNVPRPPTEDAAGGINPDPNTRTTFALIATVSGRSVVMGFIPPPLAQIMFTPDQQDRDMQWRHPSGTLQTISPAGSYEMQHTGGAYIRMAAPGAMGAAVPDSVPPDQHEDLTPFGANLNWALPLNNQPWLTACSPIFKLTVAPPNGDTTVESGGFLTIQYVGDGTVELGGNLKILVAGSAYISAGGDVSVQTPANATLTAGGSASVQAVGNASLTAGGDAFVQAAGSANVEAAGDAQLAAGGAVSVLSNGDASVSAGGNVSVSAGGDAQVNASGDLNLGAGGSMTLSASDITADTGTFTVTGVIVEEDDFLSSITGAVSGSGGGGGSPAAGAAGAAQAAAGQAAPVAGQAETDAQQATADVKAARDRAQAASNAALGTVARLVP